MSKLSSPRVVSRNALFLSLIRQRYRRRALRAGSRQVSTHGGLHDPPTRRIGLKPPANPKLPTLFLVDDSTVRNGHADGAGAQWGWGEPLLDLIDTTRINVDNRAIGGDENGEVDNPILKIHETVHTYGWYLRKYVEDTKAKGAIPIICSPIPRKTWKDGKTVRNSANYGGWARQVAEQEHIAFIDLNEIIARRYDALGESFVEPLFADPHTHTSRAGAELNAECVVAGLKALPHDPVAAYFSAKGKAVAPYVE
jgi:hypothetical protein